MGNYTVMRDSISASSKLYYRRITAPEAWQAFFFPHATFPDLSPKIHPIKVLLHVLSEKLIEEHALHQEVALQVWKLGPGTGGEVVNDHASAWGLDLGRGVWPNRAPPSGWTDEALSDAAAAMFRGDEIPLMSHKLLRITTQEDKRLDVVSKLRGSGALIQIFSKEPSDLLLKKCRDTFLPTIVERRFRSARYYLPVVDAETLAAAKDNEELDRWLCGARVYCRESAEDKGFVLASQVPLLQILEQCSQQTNVQLIDLEAATARYPPAPAISQRFRGNTGE